MYTNSARQFSNAEEPHFVALGTIRTSAPRTALLAALRQLRPQFEVRLKQLPDDGVGAYYRVEVADDMVTSHEHTIGLWLRIKSALMAAFPADKPHGVTATDA